MAKKLKIIKAAADVAAALGAGHRAAYLELNRHGFASNKKVFRSKKAYSRNQKHR